MRGTATQRHVSDVGVNRPVRYDLPGSSSILGSATLPVRWSEATP